MNMDEEDNLQKLINENKDEINVVYRECHAHLKNFKFIKQYESVGKYAGDISSTLLNPLRTIVFPCSIINFRSIQKKSWKRNLYEKLVYEFHNLILRKKWKKAAYLFLTLRKFYPYQYNHARYHYRKSPRNVMKYTTMAQFSMGIINYMPDGDKYKMKLINEYLKYNLETSLGYLNALCHLNQYIYEFIKGKREFSFVRLKKIGGNYNSDSPLNLIKNAFSPLYAIIKYKIFQEDIIKNFKLQKNIKINQYEIFPINFERKEWLSEDEKKGSLIREIIDKAMDAVNTTSTSVLMYYLIVHMSYIDGNYEQAKKYAEICSNVHFLNVDAHILNTCYLLSKKEENEDIEDDKRTINSFKNILITNPKEYMVIKEMQRTYLTLYKNSQEMIYLMIQGILYHVDVCHPSEMEIKHCKNGWSFLLELLNNALNNALNDSFSDINENNSYYWYKIDEILKIREEWWQKYFFSRRCISFIKNEKELLVIMAQVSIFMSGIQNTFVEIHLKDILSENDIKIIRQLENNFII